MSQDESVTAAHGSFVLNETETGNTVMASPSGVQAYTERTFAREDRLQLASMTLKSEFNDGSSVTVRTFVPDVMGQVAAQSNTIHHSEKRYTS